MVYNRQELDVGILSVRERGQSITPLGRGLTRKWCLALVGGPQTTPMACISFFSGLNQISLVVRLYSV